MGRLHVGLGGSNLRQIAGLLIIPEVPHDFVPQRRRKERSQLRMRKSAAPLASDFTIGKDLEDLITIEIAIGAFLGEGFVRGPRAHCT